MNTEDAKKFTHNMNKGQMNKLIEKGIPMGPTCKVCKISDPLGSYKNNTKMNCTKCHQFVCPGCMCICDICLEPRITKCDECCPTYVM